MFELEESVSVSRANNMNPIVLAFVGDAVYTLYVRTRLAVLCDAKAGQLNKQSAETVRASAQAELSDALIHVLTEEELAVFRRARNAKKGTRAKNSTVSDYNKSTGLEAVFGYLYVSGQKERLKFLLNQSEKATGTAAGEKYED